MAINGVTDTIGGLATVAAINRTKFPIAAWRSRSLRPKGFEASADGALSQLKDADVSSPIEQWYYN